VDAQRSKQSCLDVVVCVNKAGEQKAQPCVYTAAQFTLDCGDVVSDCTRGGS
jgi:hypothetical protein